jgi:hypothetical protein
MGNRTPTWSRIMSMALVVVVTIALVMPIASYAMIRTIGGGGGVQPQAIVTTYSNGVVAQSTSYGTVGHGGYHVPTTSTLSQSTPTMSTKEVITITKTYTQTIYYTTVINNIITKYMMPIIKYEFTLVNIGQYQEVGYHSLNHEELFLPGYGGGSGIFVPVFAQEAVYAYNIAPSTKPQITGWYVGSQSQSSTTSTSKSTTPPQLSSVQQYVDNAQQAVNTINQLATTNPKGLASTTYVYYSNTLFSTNTQVITKPYPYTPKPYYYSQQDIQSAYSTAWNDLTHLNILGAIYNAGRGAYMQGWNTLAGAVYGAYKFMLSAGNAFNTATLAKNIALGFGTITSYVSSLLTHW